MGVIGQLRYTLMTIKRHEAMILSWRRRYGARQKFSPYDFSFANSCRQIHIFCAKFIISSHLATMAIGSANPALSKNINPSLVLIQPQEDPSVDN